jgi:polyisoprenoid-binding protein YceI
MKRTTHRLHVVLSSLALLAGVAQATNTGQAEDASAVSQYRQLRLTGNPAAAAAGHYTLDPHHTSVVAKLAHMNLSRYTLRFDKISGGFEFNPANARADNLAIVIDPASVDTGDPAFDRKIASSFLQAGTYPTIRYEATAVTIVGNHATLRGTLEFHGVKKPLVLEATYRGFAQARMGFSGEATFRRSQFGVSQWVPLEADEVTIMVETEFVRSS